MTGKRISPKTALTAIIVGTLVFLALYQDRSYRKGGVKTGTEAPGFELAEVSTGERVALSDLRGKPVMLVFWATWCEPCKEELPTIEALHQELGDEVAILGIVNEPAPVVLHFLGQRDGAGMGLSFPVLLDATNRIHVAYAANTIPYTVFVAPDGTVADSYVGGVDGDHLRDVAQGLLAR